MNFGFAGRETISDMVGGWSGLGSGMPLRRLACTCARSMMLAVHPPAGPICGRSMSIQQRWFRPSGKTL